MPVRAGVSVSVRVCVCARVCTCLCFAETSAIAFVFVCAHVHSLEEDQTHTSSFPGLGFMHALTLGYFSDRNSGRGR